MTRASRFLYPLFFVAVFVFVVVGGRDALSQGNYPPGYIYRCGGTGFLHVTSDVEDSNCQQVDLASSDVKHALPQSKGGLGAIVPGPAGNALVSNGTVWTSGSVGGWSIAYDCDWTAESSRSLNVAANFTACGATWHSEPNTFGRGDTSIVNGSGLIIQTNTGASGYGGWSGAGNKNAPLVELPFSELGLPAAFDAMTSQMRICAWIPSQTIAAATFATTGAFFGVDNDPPQGTTPTDWFSIVLIRTGTSGTAPDLSLQVGFGSWTGVSNSSRANVPGVTSWTSAVSTACLYIPSLAPVQNYSASYGGAYSSGFPTQIPWNYYFLSNAGSGMGSSLIGFTNPSATAIGSRFGIVIGAANGAGFAHPDTVTFARIRVEYKL